MLRAATTRSPMLSRASAVTRRKFSSSPLEADSGKLGTSVYHATTLSLAVLTPAYFLVPDSYTDGVFNKALGVFVSATVTAHSWIGLNYVATDYVPKISKKLIGPARIANAGLAAITFLGLARIAVSSKGGIKGCIKGLWNPPQEK